MRDALEWDMLRWLGRIRVPIKNVLAHVTCVIEFCEDCGRRQPLVWWADNALWYTLADGEKTLCPECFDRRARARGLFLRWVPQVEPST
jgi:hypothetical protein